MLLRLLLLMLPLLIVAIMYIACIMYAQITGSVIHNPNAVVSLYVAALAMLPLVVAVTLRAALVVLRVLCVCATAVALHMAAPLRAVPVTLRECVTAVALHVAVTLRAVPVTLCVCVPAVVRGPFGGGGVVGRKSAFGTGVARGVVLVGCGLISGAVVLGSKVRGAVVSSVAVRDDAASGGGVVSGGGGVGGVVVSRWSLWRRIQG